MPKKAAYKKTYSQNHDDERVWLEKQQIRLEKKLRTQEEIEMNKVKREKLAIKRKLKEDFEIAQREEQERLDYEELIASIRN